MYPLPFFASFLLPLVIATPLTLAPAQPLNLSPLTTAPLSPPTNLTALGVEIGCFNPTKTPPFISTNKPDCEVALDAWVRGHSLIQSRTFSRKATASSTIDDVLLPVQRTSGSCWIHMDTISEDDEVTMTLAEIYAEVLGPDGVMKQCLGQVRLPAIGGRMSVGARGLLKIVVTGVGVGTES